MHITNRHDMQVTQNNQLFTTCKWKLKTSHKVVIAFQQIAYLIIYIWN